MSSEQLGKLTTLAEKRADQSRDQLKRELQQLQQIDSHSRELRSINQEYQQGTIDKTSISPQMLAQSRGFVEQLTEKLEQLDVQREQKAQRVNTQKQECHQRAAQHAALDLVHKNRVQEHKLMTERRDQQQLDEVAARQFFQRQRHEQEQGND